MKEFSKYKKSIFLILVSLALFFSVHLILQFDSFVANNLRNYEFADGEISKIKKPFDKITNENLLHWDAVHYHKISETGYEKESLYLYAFFPLFPLLWKATMLPPTGIIVLNYLLFLISVVLLWHHFSESKNYWILLLLLNLPFITPFVIPYTEALFFISITLALLGFLKGNYWLYFVGALLTAMTRSAITIVFLSVVATEGLFLLKNKNLKQTLTRFVGALLPLILGTFLVLIYQKLSGADSLFTYVDAIKTWDRKLGISTGLRDWSQEGFGLNVATIAFAIPMAILILVENVWNTLKKQPIRLISNNTTSKKEHYLVVLSAVYTMGMFLTNILFQGGSINGLFRYVLCTPFFFVLLLYFIKSKPLLNFESKLIFFCCVLFFGIFIMSMTGYSASWGFSDMGFVLFMLSMGLFLFNDFRGSIKQQIPLLILIFLNVFWNTYMFNIFVCNGWIFT